VHVPKTGGTTMGQILLRNFGASFYSYYGLWDTKQLSKGDVSGILKLHPQYRCIASHMFSLDLPYESKIWELSAFSFVRHPVDRALSLYFHNVRMNQESSANDYVKKIEPFFEKVFAEKIDPGFFDYQTRFFLPNGECESPVEKILELVRGRKVLLAPLDRFADACLLLEKRFPHDFINTAFTRMHMKSPRNQEIPRWLEDKILEHNQRDLELFDSVAKIFTEQCMEYFPDENALELAKANFAKRVDYLRQREKMEHLRNRITRGFGDLLGRIFK
jgi:hypothetical protein